MNIDTITFSHLLETDEFADLSHFLSNTAFIICHKNEPVETLLSVLWYLPARSPIIMVTNCAENEFAAMQSSLASGLKSRSRVYLIHQKDRGIASFFREHGIEDILGDDGLVVNGKGEGMYIGTLAAILLGYPKWIVFFDADNLVPSALLEYTLAMGRLFRAELPTTEPLLERPHARGYHNIRVSWASKPDLDRKSMREKVVGRCTRVVSPFINSVIEDQFGKGHPTLTISNAGEQALTIEAARALRFSSGFSVETFLLLDFFAQAGKGGSTARLQEYQARSPHFHEKKSGTHIKKMIEESLGCFLHFEPFLTERVRKQLEQVIEEQGLSIQKPRIYPALDQIHPTLIDSTFIEHYHLHRKRLDQHVQEMIGLEQILQA